MKLVMTLVVRDEADVIESTLRYHLHQGVDLVIVSDHASRDGTREILESYARAGFVHVIDRPSGDFPPGKRLVQGGWQTEMARMAAADFGADWVINADADEFWWPAQGSLRDTFAEIPDRFDVLTAPRPDFVPRPDGARTFLERMTVRQTLSDRRVKQAHRARADIVVGIGSHDVEAEGLVDVPWWPARILHYPMRDSGQYEKRMRFRAAGLAVSGKNHEWHEAYRAGRVADLYALKALDDAAVEEGIRAGRLTVDERLRDYLSTRPDPLEDLAAFAAARARAGTARAPAPGTMRPGWLGERAVAQDLAEIHLDMVSSLRRRAKDLAGDRARIEARLREKQEQVRRLKEERRRPPPGAGVGAEAARRAWRRLRAQGS